MAQMCPACSHNNQDNNMACAQCRAPLQKLLGQHTVLVNRYSVAQVLGCGGMGAVYLAQDQNVLGRLVAVKENLSDSAQAQQQFQSEVHVMVGLRHPGLPSVTDQFTGALNRQYLVMDYIDGETLEDFVTRHHPLPLAQVIDLGLQLLDVLNYLHSRSIIHRDIKPTNIRLTADGKAVLVDFGISKVHMQGQPTQLWGKGVGTAGYAPLEQYGISNAGTDARTDLYSLGAVLYFTLTAQTPPSALELDRGVKPLTPPMKLRPDAPLALQRLLFTAMALRKERRYQTANDMRQALTGAAVNTPITPVAKTLPTPAASAPASNAASTPTIRDFQPLPSQPPLPTGSAQSPPAPFAYQATPPTPYPTPETPPLSARSPVASCLQLGCVLVFITLLLVVLIGGGYFYLRDGKLPSLSTLLSPTITHLSLPGLVAATDTPISSATATPVPVNKVLSVANIAQVAPLRRLGKGELHQLVWSPDGQWLAVASSLDVFLYAVQADQLVEKTALEVGQSAESIAFSAQSNQVAVGLTDGSLQVHKVTGGPPIQQWAGHAGAVVSVAFSPTDNALLASGGQDHLVHLWQLGNHTAHHTFSESQGEISSVAFTPDGQTLAAGERHPSWNPLRGLWVGKVYLWRVTDGTLLHTLDNDMHRVNGLAFSPDGQTLVTGEAWLTLQLWHGRLRLWRVDTGQFVRVLGDNKTAVESVAFAPDGNTIAAGLHTGAIDLRRISDGATLRAQTADQRNPVSVAFSPNHELLAAGSADGTLWLWRAADGTLLQTLSDYTQAIHTVAFAPDGMLAWGEASSDFKQRNGAVQLWRGPTSTPLRKIEDPTEDGDIEAVAFSADGAGVAAGGSWSLKVSDPRLDGAVRLWQVADGSLLRTFEETQGVVKSIAFSPDGKLLAAGENPPLLGGTGAVRIWSVGNVTPIQTLGEFEGAAESVTFSANGQWLAAGLANGQVRVWQVKDWSLVQTLAQHTGSVQSVAFSPDSRLLASGAADQRVLLWHVTDGTLVNTLSVGASVHGIAFAPHGALLATGSEDGVVRLWGTSDGRLVRELPGHQAAVRAVAFSPDGALLVSGAQDKTVQIWGIP